MDLANIIGYFKGNLAKITVFSAKITVCPTGGQQVFKETIDDYYYNFILSCQK
ncbi:hypothetical protein RIR_e33115_A0A2N1NGG1_9GLOM [Rhizophagus irregularis DAOM 181602=DAOM 197198]|nr:hypothetical protein RIR_e33115_A0A2N1NGG1_9GLOM [Rhizophagus irregularis DAOM 181602=DAOM 197198]